MLSQILAIRSENPVHSQLVEVQNSNPTKLIIDSEMLVTPVWLNLDLIDMAFRDRIEFHPFSGT